VNEILAEEIGKIHAFELKTWTSQQWETKKGEFGL
jgi:stress-induced morphogen